MYSFFFFHIGTSLLVFVHYCMILFFASYLPSNLLPPSPSPPPSTSLHTHKHAYTHACTHIHTHVQECFLRHPNFPYMTLILLLVISNESAITPGPCQAE